MVGFGALLLTPLIETRSVGIGGLVVVAVAVLLSITLLPALLAVLGREIDRPRWLARRLTWYHAPQVWEKWARTLSRHPIRALAYGGAVIALLTLPVFFIKIGLPSRHWWPAGTEAGDGLEALSRDGRGRVHPADAGPGGGARGRSAVEAASLRGLMTLSDSLQADPRVREVRSLVNVEARGSLLELLGALQRPARGARQVSRLPRRLPEQRPAARPDGRDPGRHDLAHDGHGRGDRGRGSSPGRSSGAPRG